MRSTSVMEPPGLGPTRMAGSSPPQQGSCMSTGLGLGACHKAAAEKASAPDCGLIQGTATVGSPPHHGNVKKSRDTLPTLGGWWEVDYLYLHCSWGRELQLQIVLFFPTPGLSSSMVETYIKTTVLDILSRRSFPVTLQGNFFQGTPCIQIGLNVYCCSPHG